MSQRFEVDERRIAAKPGEPDHLLVLDPAKPPQKPIAFQEFPMVVYKHPREAFKRVEHRNANHELVHTEIEPAEHLTKKVENAAELEAALKSGWVKEPYIAPPLPDPNSELYEAAEAEAPKKARK